jgi:hypothetical protein
MFYSDPSRTRIPQRGTGEPESVSASYQQISGLAERLLLPSAVLLLGFALSGPNSLNAADSVRVSGELRQWHKVTLTLAGPAAHETDVEPNPFLDYRMTVRFAHESGTLAYAVPGYFAADGDAANTSAASGDQWRAHLSPDRPGQWTYQVSFVRGELVAIEPERAGEPVTGVNGLTGSFSIKKTNKKGRDLRGQGRLEYVGKHHLRFAGSGRYFLKAGADAPENLLAYSDFDGTYSHKNLGDVKPGEAAPEGLKTWASHARDWRRGDPTWKNGKGKGLIGALNYLSGKGCNVFSFLPYNAGGDGDDVWPFVDRNEKLHYDCSKLDQWQRVFDHAQARGLYLHFKLQETEIDDNFAGHNDGNQRTVPTALDGGDLGVERKLYCRELVARFGHELALNWNLGEENTQSSEQVRAMSKYLRDTDPYDHHIVVHTYPDWQDKVYPPLLGDGSVLTGASLQNSWSAAHQRTLKWLRASAEAGKPWVVANDEQNPADMGVPPDPGYAGHDGVAVQSGKPYTLHDVRKLCLWGTLMAGGAGVEYYFGYKLPQNDLVCDDWRSRDRSWDYCRIALDCFSDNEIPFWEMSNADDLVGNPKNNNSRYCLAKAGELYLVYSPQGGATELDLTDAVGSFTVNWFNPREGGKLLKGKVRKLEGGTESQLGLPPSDVNEDWLAIVRRD